MKKFFISLVVFVFAFGIFKSVFAETTGQTTLEKWVVTLGVTDLTIKNVETGEESIIQIPANTILKVDQEEETLYNVTYNGSAGTILKDKVRDATLWEIHPTATLVKVTKNTVLLHNENGKLVARGSVKANTLLEKVGEKDNLLIIKYVYFNQTVYIDKNSTIPLPGQKMPVPNITVTPAKVTVGITKRYTDILNPSNKTVVMANIAPLQKIEIKSEYQNYYVVKIGGNTGLVLKTNILLKTNNYIDPYGNYSYSEMATDLQELTISYPSFTKLETIGKSVDGRNIYAIKLGTGKEEISLNGSHHAREHMTTNVLMEMLDQYANAYEKNLKISGYDVKTLLSKTSIYFVPMVNPDGVMLVQQGASSAKNPSYVIKLNKGSKDFTAWKANVRGVDLNRQYPANWANLTGVKPPGPDNYKGTSPLTEPEVKALYDYTNRHSFKNTIAYHSSGNIIFWHYNQTGTQYTRDKAIATKLSNQTGYSLVAPAKGGGGGYKDWYVATKKQPGYTIEIAPYVGNKPVPNSYFSSIMQKNLPIGLIMAAQPAS